MGDLAEQTAVITGAARGIGRAIGLRLAREDAHVILTDVDEGTEAVDAVEEAGGTAEFVKADVTDESDMEAVFEDRSVDVVVNNAGYYAPLAGPENKKRFDDIELDEWDTVMGVNATGVFITSKAAMASLVEGGRIINMSSGVALQGVPGFAHYVASKAAVIGLTRAIAAELGDQDIRVNAITPGLTASEATMSGGTETIDYMTKRQSISRQIQPEDIADAVAFLASPDSDMITGQVLNVDGGVVYY